MNLNIHLAKTKLGSSTTLWNISAETRATGTQEKIKTAKIWLSSFHSWLWTRWLRM